MIIDLCCGLGRFESNEDVISIDIDRKVKPTIIASVTHLPLKQGLRPRLCHASPPCTYLSYARYFHYPLNEKGIAESLRIVAACLDAFDWLEAKTWTLENPQGILSKIMPTDIETRYSVADIKEKRTKFWSNNRSLKRALIPQDVRQKILSVCS